MRRRKQSRQSSALVPLAKQINQEHQRTVAAAAVGLQHAVRAGLLLLKAKRAVGHGAWGRWIEEHCEFSQRTAEGYQRVARRWPEFARTNPQRVADSTSLREALALLAAPKPEPDSPVREPEPVRVFAKVRMEPPSPPTRTLIRLTEPPEPAEPRSNRGQYILATASHLVGQVEELVDDAELLDEDELKQIVGAMLAAADAVDKVRRTSPYPQFSDQAARDAWDAPFDATDPDPEDT